MPGNGAARISWHPQKRYQRHGGNQPTTAKAIGKVLAAIGSPVKWIVPSSSPPPAAIAGSEIEMAVGSMFSMDKATARQAGRFVSNRSPGRVFRPARAA